MTYVLVDRTLSKMAASLCRPILGLYRISYVF